MSVCSVPIVPAEPNTPFISPNPNRLDNVLVTDDWVAKLADFGLSREADDGTMTQCGTPFYMASGPVQSNEIGRLRGQSVEARSVFGVRCEHSANQKRLPCSTDFAGRGRVVPRHKR